MAFNIKVVSEQTGVSVHVLRQWERRYGVPSPNRADNRYRLYDEADIADVLAIKRQVESGVSPAQASAWLRQHQKTQPAVAAVSNGAQLVSRRMALEDAFMRADEILARQLLEEAFALFALDQVVTQIIQPAMETLGAEWMRGRATVAQEHLASNLIRQKLITLIQAQGAPSPGGFHFIAASAPEEEHELGLLALVLLARHQGWRVTYLGQRTPLVEMAHQARAQKANAIVVSVTTVLGLASLIPWFAKTNRPDVPVAIGGHVASAAPRLRDHLPGTYLGDAVLTSLRALATRTTPHKYWTPSKKMLRVALMLREFRLKITSETITQLADSMRAWGFARETLSHPTLYLVDMLACAIAFDAPELVDLQDEWLGEAMPPQQVQSQRLEKHIQIFKRVVEKNLGKDNAEAVEQLLERLGK